MLTLVAHRPKHVTLGRTQGYRLVLDFSGSTADFNQSNSPNRYKLSAEVFVCTRETTSKVVHFERVASGNDMINVTTDNTQPEWRTSHLDLLVYTESIADDMLDDIVEDIEELVANSGPSPRIVGLDGATT